MRRNEQRVQRLLQRQLRGSLQRPDDSVCPELAMLIATFGKRLGKPVRIQQQAVIHGDVVSLHVVGQIE